MREIREGIPNKSIKMSTLWYATVICSPKNADINSKIVFFVVIGDASDPPK